MSKDKREPDTTNRTPKLEVIVNANRMLFEAVATEDLHGISTWLARGADVNARDYDQKTPLFLAVYAWVRPDIAELLIDQGADVRARDTGRGTPLHSAAFFGDEKRIGLLLDHGAEIDARDEVGRTPLHTAAAPGRVEETAYLVRRGADTGVRDHRGQTPLDLVRDNNLLHLLGGDRVEPLERLLGGFVTLKVIGVQPDSLILRVENHYTRYPDAKREAKKRGTIAFHSRGLEELPDPDSEGRIRCPKGLSDTIDKAWWKAHSKKQHHNFGMEM